MSARRRTFCSVPVFMLCWMLGLMLGTSAPANASRTYPRTQTVQALVIVRNDSQAPLELRTSHLHLAGPLGGLVRASRSTPSILHLESGYTGELWATFDRTPVSPGIGRLLAIAGASTPVPVTLGYGGNYPVLPHLDAPRPSSEESAFQQAAFAFEVLRAETNLDRVAEPLEAIRLQLLWIPADAPDGWVGDRLLQELLQWRQRFYLNAAAQWTAEGRIRKAMWASQQVNGGLGSPVMITGIIPSTHTSRELRAAESLVAAAVAAPDTPEGWLFAEAAREQLGAIGPEDPWHTQAQRAVQRIADIGTSVAAQSTAGHLARCEVLWRDRPEGWPAWLEREAAQVPSGTPEYERAQELLALLRPLRGRVSIDGMCATRPDKRVRVEYTYSNTARRAVQKVTVQVQYLNAAGLPLGEPVISVSPQTLKSGQRQHGKSQLFDPGERVASVRLTLLNISFADGSSWHHDFYSPVELTVEILQS